MRGSTVNWDLAERCRIYQRTESAEFVSLPLGEGNVVNLRKSIAKILKICNDILEK